jgi:2-polyprenyl-3-methyl-5-hydroxy-6-metoxy-1,4-benzoquinol methylase
MMTPAERLRRKNEFDGSLTVGTRKFNLGAGRDACVDTRERAIAALVDPGTGLLRAELARERACPLCGKTAATLLFVKQGFRHVRCDECRMIYVNPVLQASAVRASYENEEAWTRVLFNDLQQSLDGKKFRYGLDLIAEHVGAPGRLLDVGCGPGFFLQVARAAGWTVTGVELNQRCVEHVRNLGIPVVDRLIEEANLPDRSYECVTMWDVLEHLIEPNRVLAELWRLLVPGGVLLVQVPNADALVTRLLHERSWTFGGDSHVNFYSPENLRRALVSARFEAVDCETIITELGTINNYLSYDDPYFGDAGPVLDVLRPEFIHDRLLGSKLLAIARTERA